MKKKYCIFCGEEIKEETKKCKKCKKSINPKCLLLKEYIGDHLKDDIKCNIEVVANYLKCLKTVTLKSKCKSLFCRLLIGEKWI